MEPTAKFNFTLDGAPYLVQAEPCRFNSDLQYRVSVNGADDVLFTFDNQLGRYAPIGNDSISIPDNLEIAIGSHLNGLCLGRP